MKFRKKPIVIEAIQYTGENRTEIFEFASDVIVGVCESPNNLFPNHLEIKTDSGDTEVNINDWVIKGIKGEFYPCKPDVFESTYVKVCETSERLRCKPIRRGGMS